MFLLSNKRYWIFIINIFFLLFFSYSSVQAETLIPPNFTISTNTTWLSSGSPYIIEGTVFINANRKLTIQEGTIIKFKDINSKIQVKNLAKLDILGTQTNKVYLTSYTNDLIGGDTNNDGNTTQPTPNSFSGIALGSASTTNINYTELTYASTGINNVGGTLNINSSTLQHNGTYGIIQSNGVTNIIDSTISFHDYGIYQNTGDVNITNSNITDNLSYGAYNIDGPFIAINNYWGHTSGPLHTTINPLGLGNQVSDLVLFDPWVGTKFGEQIPICTENCFSNVMFLPGMMGSRIYDNGINCGDSLSGSGCDEDGREELWFSAGDALQKKLELNTEGKSANNLFTVNDTTYDGNKEKGIVDEVLSFNIYKSFIQDLKNLKEDKIISDYDFIPYDWRLSLSDIITNGKVIEKNLSYIQDQDFKDSFILKKLEELQKTSKSGKVTIISHSNGGLVTKALIQKLKDTNNPLYEKIDKVIFVAVPQVGTPEALISLLHGRSLLGGFIMKAKRQRQIAENMPVTYNLLPSESYFNTINTQAPFNENLITFPTDFLFNFQNTNYGSDIANEGEFKDYILGKEGRIKPIVDNLNHPNIGNSTLYDQAKSVHAVLDNWQAPLNTKVIQVGGWGEETISGIDYKVKHGELSFNPRIVVDGDATVVIPSALWMPQSQNVERWWVDLKTFNEDRSPDRIHKDILEIPNLLNFLNSEIKDKNNFVDPENIIVNNPSTLISNDNRLHFILHSPLSLGVTNTDGKYTGLDITTGEIKEEIPDVKYIQIGDTQFLSIPYGFSFTLKLIGYQQGNFSLDIEKQNGNIVTNTNIFDNIPTTSTTTATIDITPDFKVESAKLKLDKEGDGIIDVIYPLEEKKEENPTPVFTQTNNTGGGGARMIIPPIQDTPNINIAKEPEILPIDILKQENNILDIAQDLPLNTLQENTKKETLRKNIVLNTQININKLDLTEDERDVPDQAGTLIQEKIPLEASVNKTNFTKNAKDIFLYVIMLISSIKIILLVKKKLR